MNQGLIGRSGEELDGLGDHRVRLRIPDSDPSSQRPCFSPETCAELSCPNRVSLNRVSWRTKTHALANSLLALVNA